MNEEYTDDQIEEWTREDLLNAPLLSDEEIQELRTNKRQLTAYAKQKLRKMKAQQQTQELLNAAHRIADGGVPLGKLIREGHNVNGYEIKNSISPKKGEKKSKIL
jgi:hypothetical protein